MFTSTTHTTTFAHVPSSIFRKSLLKVDIFYLSTPGLFVFSHPHLRLQVPPGGAPGQGAGEGEGVEGQHSESELLHRGKSNAIKEVYNFK